MTNPTTTIDPEALADQLRDVALAIPEENDDLGAIGDLLAAATYLRVRAAWMFDGARHAVVTLGRMDRFDLADALADVLGIDLDG